MSSFFDEQGRTRVSAEAYIEYVAGGKPAENAAHRKKGHFRMETTITEEDISNMAKKEQKKPSKKPQTKGADKAKKAGAGAKKASSQAKKPVSPPKKAAPPAEKAAAPETKATPKPAKATKFFSVAEFAAMTYLTENGVMQWLKQGLLKGQQDEKGDWQVEASNLEVPNVKRLVR
jgi:hypothetical protein